MRRLHRTTTRGAVTLKIEKLHRIHASVATRGGRTGKGGGVSFDVGGTAGARWRGDGGTGEMRAAMAHRLALCWNLAEGWPTAALEEGILLKEDDAVVELLAAVAEAEDTGAWGPVRGAAQRLRDLRKCNTGRVDITDGRLHDCAGCLARDESTGGEAVT